jgi:hypothetical protein
MPNTQENVREAMNRGALRALKESGYSSREEMLREASDLGFIEPLPPQAPGGANRPQ